MTTQEKVKDDKKKKECVACGDECDSDAIGIVCSSSHFLCNGCSKEWVNSLLGSINTKITDNGEVKCSTCTAGINPVHVERYIEGQEAMHMFVTAITQRKLNENEEIANCQYCSYFEIWSKHDSMSFMTCSNPCCNKTHCYICKQQVPTISQEYYDEICNYDEDDNDADAIAEFEAKQEQREKHFKCTELKTVLQEFHKAIEIGQTNVCPKCKKYPGQKDDDCTHMTCANCAIRWCYICGIAEADLENDNNGFIVHNSEYYDDVDKCPMYFSELIDDEDDDANDQQLKEKYHHIKTIRSLRALIKRIGMDKFKELWDTYEQVKNCGYTMDDIKHMSTEYLIANKVIGGIPEYPPLEKV